MKYIQIIICSVLLKLLDSASVSPSLFAAFTHLVLFEQYLHPLRLSRFFTNEFLENVMEWCM